MTRWARAGNSQRHQKIPGEATKWGEFDLQKAKALKIKNETKLKSEKSDTDFSARKNVDKIKKFKKKKLHLNKKVNDDGNQSESKIQSNEFSTISSQSDFNNSVNEEKNIESSYQQQDISTEKVQSKKRKRSKKNDVQSENSETSQTFENKKSKYLEKLQKKRAKNGILLLPAKVERKLYNIKRRLREKNLPASLIVEIIRKERRKEELKFRKTIGPSKICFNCRKPGHILADCPDKLGSSNQETGICFKCGSKEHSSFKCLEKVEGFPFAKCFICKEQGHISKDCPNNKHGVYPKGGRCNLCGNVNHLKKDCPTLRKNVVDSESTVTLQMMDGVSSIDAEVPEKTKVKTKNYKKPKIVKF